MIRPYHLKKGQNPYWIRTIRTRWHVCKPVAAGSPRPYDRFRTILFGGLGLGLRVGVLGVVRVLVMVMVRVSIRV